MHNLNHSEGQPPIGGSILWERSLFERIKRTIVRFLTLEDMMNCDEGEAVKDHYLRVAKQMKAYEDERYEKWRVTTELNLPGLLRRTLLTKGGKNEELVRDHN
jgi:dynein heavy chain